MKPRWFFILIVLYFTAISIFAVSLRSANNHIFYKLYVLSIEQNRLKQELWQKQLQVENLISPASISKQLDY
jgi:hypothetical protein